MRVITPTMKAKTKTASASYQDNKPIKDQTLNRRAFIQKIGAASVGLIAAPSLVPALAAASESAGQTDSGALTKDDLPVAVISTPPQLAPTRYTARCIAPTIDTRLFASSNVGSNDARNQLALERLACAGFKIDNPEIVDRQYLRFAGTDIQRASDLQNLATGAIKAPKLLMGVRGGYGAMRILPMIDWQTLGRIMTERGTILTGFSDVTAIQCALLAQGQMSSLAAPMLYSEFGKASPDRISCQQFVTALTDPNLTITIQSADLTSPQLPTVLARASKTITGTIWGGNLSVVSALAGSPYLPRVDGGIVFLEDVGEQTYRIERMLYDLYLAGVFKNQQAIIFGSITGQGEDSYDARYDVATVIRQLHEITGLPIYNGMRFGHIAQKQSFPLGARCQISTDTSGGYRLDFSDYPIIEASRINTAGLWQDI